MFGTGWSFLVLVAGATAEANAVADAAAGRMPHGRKEGLREMALTDT